jgi:hypothetical protein
MVRMMPTQPEPDCAKQALVSRSSTTHEDPDDLDEPCVANVWAPAAAWGDREQFENALKRIIGGDPRAFSIDYIDLVPRDAILSDPWME